VQHVQSVQYVNPWLSVQTVPDDMRVSVDPWDPTPVYRQVAALLRGEVEAGRIEPGDPLPSELTVQQRYGVSRGTARAAIAALRASGHAVTLPGRGSFVPPDYKPPA
jgi:DNA-binding GntR family transcriptional regulator